MVSKKNHVYDSFSQIYAQLKMRHELITNLINISKKYISHKDDALESITKARSDAISAKNKLDGSPDDLSAIKGVVEAEDMLGKAVSGFQLIMETYPDFKANQNIMQLNEELASTENKISFSRQHYNDEVVTYNRTTEYFPELLFALILTVYFLFIFLIFIFMS